MRPSFTLAKGWQRLAVALGLSLAPALTLHGGWTLSSLLFRTVSLGLVAVLVFGLFEQLPKRLPRWLARWVLQVVGVGVAMPLTTVTIYVLSTRAGARPFWLDKPRMDGPRRQPHLCRAPLLSHDSLLSRFIAWPETTMDSWHYEPTADYDQAPVERLKNFPRQPDFIVYTARTLANLFIRGLLRTYHRMSVVGRENLPASGSYVLVGNHSSHLDAVALLASLPMNKIHRAFPAAASDYFFTSLPRLAFSAVVVNAMPFDRKENPRQSLEVCRQLLETPGHVLILFPEGTRTSDGNLGRFKPGVGFLIAGSEIPVVPCYLHGAFAAWPKGKWIPRPRKLSLHIGSPVNFRGSTPTKEDAVTIADTLRNAVMALRLS